MTEMTTKVPGLKEIGSDSVITISTAKSANGVEQLRDNNIETFWQSDGTAPHLINIQFTKKMSVCCVCLYMDYATDESYTTKKLTVRSGTMQHDLSDVANLELNEPNGWVNISLMKEDNEPLRSHFLQVRVMSMHQNGKDTRIRQVCVFGPNNSQDHFKSVEMQQFAGLR
jgi:anaphase-promoting complex subunit 10